MSSSTPTPSYANSGGFLHSSTLPSPAPSTASNRAAASLPHPRSKPLCPGSRKEYFAREYVSSRLLHISRRYVKKFGIPDPADEAQGYETFDEVCKDMEEVVDVLWFSATPGLQIPYFLQIAFTVAEYMPSFPPSPRPTFALLKKLDHCLASLLCKYDIRTREPLSGLADTRGLSNTDMVRLKSLVDQTRLQVAMVMSNADDVDTWLPDEDGAADVTQVQEQDPPPACGALPSSHRSPAKRKYEDDDDHEDDHEDDDNGGDFDGDSEDEEEVAPKRRKPDSPPSVARTPPTQDEDLILPKERFHFLGEDDDSSDDDDDDKPTNTDQTTREERTEQPRAGTPPPESGLESNEEVDEAGDNPPDHHIETDEEEEELQMNVAKVYERTIVQLGKVLGDTIVGNWTRE